MRKFILLACMALMTLPLLAEQIVVERGNTTLDISELNDGDTLVFENVFKVDALMGLQFVITDITGLPDGELNLMETNSLSKPFLQVGSLDLPYSFTTAPQSVGFTKNGLPYKYLVAIITLNGMTGGNLEILYNLKQY